ncbi:uncharacterized protein [Aegilops tauschii subsp. strangulata]|uniref:uncharacterized protein n=1 Tax=Aegilops tauschii subsp. strangulata TaxID=200361 RepID=UPI003CC8462F
MAAAPLPPASWRRRPLLAALPPALRCLRAPTSAPPGTPPPPRRALAPVSRAARGAAPARGRGEVTGKSGQAPRDWGALAGRLALGALLGSAALLGCRGAALAAAEDSIKASGFGLRVAASLRSLGWPDDAVVFTLATLPVLELRGAIPAGYWMRLHPVRLTVLAVLGFFGSPGAFVVNFLQILPDKENNYLISGNEQSC